MPPIIQRILTIWISQTWRPIREAWVLGISSFGKRDTIDYNDDNYDNDNGDYNNDYDDNDGKWGLNTGTLSCTVIKSDRVGCCSVAIACIIFNSFCKLELSCGSFSFFK